MPQSKMFKHILEQFSALFLLKLNDKLKIQLPLRCDFICPTTSTSRMHPCRFNIDHLSRRRILWSDYFWFMKTKNKNLKNKILSEVLRSCSHLQGTLWAACGGKIKSVWGQLHRPLVYLWRMCAPWRAAACKREQTRESHHFLYGFFKVKALKRLKIVILATKIVDMVSY